MDDMFFDWSTTKAVLFRTTWDYFDRFPEFSIWLDKVMLQTTLLNSEKIIRWNIDKHYLLDLEKKGIHITESHFIEKGATVTLAQLHDILNWNKTVLKPCVSGAARHTYKLSLKTLKDHEQIFQDLISSESMMLQPFQYNIVEKGEISMMVFNGTFSHAILKKPKLVILEYKMILVEALKTTLLLKKKLRLLKLQFLLVQNYQSMLELTFLKITMET